MVKDLCHAGQLKTRMGPKSRGEFLRLWVCARTSARSTADPSHPKRVPHILCGLL
jgi:hypothetical protein